MKKWGNKEYVTINEAVEELSSNTSEVQELLNSFSVRESKKDGRSLYCKDDLVYAKWKASLRKELDKLSQESRKRKI